MTETPGINWTAPPSYRWAWPTDAPVLPVSLRDWFAGMVMQAFVPSSADEGHIEITEMIGPKWQAEVAALAYAMADAMLAEREKKPEVSKGNDCNK